MKDISGLAADVLLGLQLILGQTPIDPPRAIAVDTQYLSKRACPDLDARQCRVKAWYAPEGTVYIDQRLDLENDLFSRSILVHELMHHVQRMTTGTVASNCQDWRRREHEAYEAQIFWLQRKGGSPRSLRGQFPFLRCL